MAQASYHGRNKTAQPTTATTWISKVRGPKHHCHFNIGISHSGRNNVVFYPHVYGLLKNYNQSLLSAHSQYLSHCFGYLGSPGTRRLTRCAGKSSAGRSGRPEPSRAGQPAFHVNYGNSRLSQVGKWIYGDSCWFSFFLLSWNQGTVIVPPSGVYSNLTGKPKGYWSYIQGGFSRGLNVGPM